MLNCSYHTTLSHRGFKQPCSFFILSLGTGAVYSFDPVGSYERETCRAAGAAQSLVQPFLDNQVSSCFRSKHMNYVVISVWPIIYLQIYFKNQTPAPGTTFSKHLPLSTVLSLVIDSFTGATERHIEVCFLLYFFFSFYYRTIFYSRSFLFDYFRSETVWKYLLY